jgi:hypothetical protein
MASRQKAHGGGFFDSEDQRRYLWAVVPKAAHKMAHRKTTKPKDWEPMSREEANAYKRGLEKRGHGTHKSGPRVKGKK